MELSRLPLIQPSGFDRTTGRGAPRYRRCADLFAIPSASRSVVEPNRCRLLLQDAEKHQVLADYFNQRLENSPYSPPKSAGTPYLEWLPPHQPDIGQSTIESSGPHISFTQTQANSNGVGNTASGPTWVGIDELLTASARARGGGRRDHRACRASLERNSECTNANYSQGGDLFRCAHPICVEIFRTISSPRVEFSKG